MGQSGLGGKEQGGVPVSFRLAQPGRGCLGEKYQDLLQSQGFGAEGSLSMALVLKVPQKMPEAVSKHWFSVLPVTNSGVGRGLR